MRHARTSLVALYWTLLSPPGQGCAQQGDGGPASSTQAGGAAAGSAGSAGSAGKGPSVAGAGVGTAGAGAGAGQAGKGGASWTGPIGVGGMTPQGKTPVWKQVPGDPLGAGVEYLENGEEFTVFSWQPCESISRCQRAQLMADAARVTAPLEPRLTSSAKLYSDETSSQLFLLANQATITENWLQLIVGIDGRAATGVRMRAQPNLDLARIGANGTFMFASVSESTPLGDIATVKKVSGIRVSLRPTEARAFEVPVPSNYFTSTPGVLTTNRAFLGWTRIDADALSSVALDGTDFRVFAAPGQPPGYLSATFKTAPASRSHVYFNAYVQEPNGSYHVSIHYSDGVAPPSSYLEPEPGWDLGRFGYAHS